MKFAIFLSITLGVCACTKDKEKVIEEVTSNKYLEITENFSLQEFEGAKNFIIEKGDRQTYSNMYNKNPHFSFDGFEAYLNPETGQQNINCDPTISNFNQITLRDRNADPQYYTIHIVRKGDSAKEGITRPVEGMKEEKVYLLNPYENDIEVMKNNLKGYLDTIKSNY